MAQLVRCVVGFSLRRERESLETTPMLVIGLAFLLVIGRGVNVQTQLHGV